MLVAALWLLHLVACQQQVAGIDCSQGLCAGDGGAPTEDTEPPRLYIDPPFGVGFDCVTIGCEDTRVFQVENRGGGRASIVLMRLTEESSAEFALELLSDAADPSSTLRFPTEDDPLVLTRDESVIIQVRYAPNDADTDQGRLAVEWFDGAVAYEEAVIEREELPIQTRVQGTPRATPGASDVLFGFVPPGETRQAYLEISNTTEGDAVLALSPPSIQMDGSLCFSIPTTEESLYVNPGETLQIPVVYAPDEEIAHQAQVLFGTNDPARPQVSFWLRGTAVETPKLVVVEPESLPVDFGELRVGEQRAKSIVIANLGGSPLQITAFLEGEAASSPFSTMAVLGEPWPPLASLEERRIEILAAPNEGAQLSDILRLESNDPVTPQQNVELRVLGLRPLLEVSPPSLNFGEVVQNWTAPAQTFSLRNAGNGELTIRNIEWEVGSSSQLRIVSLPTLPVKLHGDDGPIDISVLMEANSLGPVRGILSVETDAAENPVQNLEVLGQVVSCDQGCPVVNGTPSCTSGRCEVGSCFERFHDTDEIYENGCECGEDTTPQGFRDIGATCSSGTDIGPLTDNCGDTNQWVTRQGTLHREGDEDLYYFQARDEGNVGCDTFGDSFKVRVRLKDPPPGVEFCVRNAGSGSNCGGENQRECGLTSFSHGGGWGGDDSRDITVWVRQVPGFFPMCSEYSIEFSANEKN